MISVARDGKLCVGWMQNGINIKRHFRSEKEANRYQDLVDDIQNAMKLAEEMEKFNREFKYDPQLVELKCVELGKEIEDLKERIRIKQSLQKKLGVANQKLSDQPRNVIDRESFMREIKQLKVEINRLDRFFREHAIVTLNRELHDALQEMKSYYQHHKESVQRAEKNFGQIMEDIIKKFPALTTALPPTNPSVQSRISRCKRHS